MQRMSNHFVLSGIRVYLLTEFVYFILVVQTILSQLIHLFTVKYNRFSLDTDQVLEGFPNTSLYTGPFQGHFCDQKYGKFQFSVATAPGANMLSTSS